MALPSLAERLALLVVPDLRADRPGAFAAAEALVRPRKEGGLGCGGLLVFGGDREGLPPALARLEEVAGQPLLTFADLERGAGQQVRGLTRLPHLMAIGAADDPALARAAGALTAREARAAGIRVAFAPCVDLNTDPQNPIINVRALGDDPERVARLAESWVAGCEGEGVLACAKHFPGHGHTRADSHDALPHVEVALALLEARELVPFARLARRGVGTVMTGHLAVPALTGAAPGAPAPVTLSARALGYLRGPLGYDGVIVSDALSMAGLTVALPEAEAGVQALAAGCDLLLCPDDPRALVARLEAALAEGELSVARVEDALARRARALARARGGEPLPRGPAAPDAEGERIALEIAERGLAALRGDRPPALGAGGAAERARVVLIAGDADLPPAALAAALARGAPEVRLLAVDPATPDERLAEVIAVARAAKAEGAPVVVVVASQPRMSKGSAGLPARMGDFARALVLAAGPPAVAVALGAPYLLEAFAGAAFAAAAFSDEPASQEAVAAMLLAGSAPRGRVPLRLAPATATATGPA